MNPQKIASIFPFLYKYFLNIYINADIYTYSSNMIWHLSLPIKHLSKFNKHVPNRPAASSPNAVVLFKFIAETVTLQKDEPRLRFGARAICKNILHCTAHALKSCFTFRQINKFYALAHTFEACG